MKLIDRKILGGGMFEDYYLREDGKITVQRWMDADPILEANAQQMGGHSMKGARNYGEGLGEQVARIPQLLVEEYLQKTGINLMTCTTAELHAFLNNPMYAKVRTAPGRV